MRLLISCILLVRIGVAVSICWLVQPDIYEVPLLQRIVSECCRSPKQNRRVTVVRKHSSVCLQSRYEHGQNTTHCALTCLTFLFKHQKFLLISQIQNALLKIDNILTKDTAWCYHQWTLNLREEGNSKTILIKHSTKLY